VSDVLNLGCGNKVLAAGPDQEVVNHDRTAHRVEVSAVHDLNDLPWPWEDNAFDQVIACSVLEHLHISLLQSIDETWRVLRPGGRLMIKPPYWKAELSYDDPTHFWKCGLGILDMFDPSTRRGKQYSFYTPRKWKILSRPQLTKELTSLFATMEVIK
jgi:SAM-dependent methyltransferase